MCECEHEEYRTTELELRVSQLEGEVETLQRALRALIEDLGGSPHAAANAAGEILAEE